MKSLKNIILEKLKITPNIKHYDGLKNNQCVTTVEMFYSWLTNLPFDRITWKDLEKFCTVITDDNWVNFDNIEDALEFLQKHKADEIIITKEEQYQIEVYTFEIDGIIFSERVYKDIPDSIKLN